ncbi:hypothetical protein MNBD_NITROSPINAE03-346 [hydrothermal vent metagenome]|uniref:Glycosyltransferase RgtA/B/C/D-like domain-containing protein n=1 Tax=hydrothermal vent metagenome TaxID=652676 RepID=A0A3B1BJI9_9ZZZZ
MAYRRITPAINGLCLKSNSLALFKHSGDPRLFALLAFFISISAISSFPWPDDQDGVNFILGVQRYDLQFHRPHFPGYPVYIMVGKLLHAVTLSPERALVALSVISGAACIWLMFVWLKKFYSRDTALLCSTALAVNPVFFEFSHKIFTEIPAMALLLASLAVLRNPANASTKRWFVSGAIMGILLGVRLSWWPYPLCYLLYAIRTGKGLNAWSGFAAGVALWLLPQADFVGARELVANGLAFTEGHFTKWGGAIGSETAHQQRLTALALRAGEAVGWIGSGTLWTRVPWAVFTLFGVFMFLRLRNSKKEVKVFLLATMFYVAWVAVGQNLEKTRHLIPLAPAAILIATPLIEKHRKTAMAVITALALTLPFDYASRTIDHPPAFGLVQWTGSIDKPNVELYCGESERFFDLYPSKSHVVMVTSAQKLADAFKASWPKPSARFVCDDIPGFVKPDGPAGAAGEPVAVFPARKGDPVDQTLSVYEM